MSLAMVTDEKMDQETAGQFVIQDQLPPDDSSATPTPVLADHMDMARPPHENPEYGSDILPAPSPTYTTIISPGPMGQSLHAVPIAIPITTFTIANTNVSFTKIKIINNQIINKNHFQNASKYIRLSPKPFGLSQKSPIRRPRGDAKKCRKVYGMEHRELWCTQCKWKKACTRFGEAV